MKPNLLLIVGFVLCGLFLSEGSIVSPNSVLGDVKIRSNDSKNRKKPWFSTLVGKQQSSSTRSEPPLSLLPFEQQHDHFLQSSQALPYAMSTPQILYVILTSVFVTCLLIADILGVKLFEVALPFPIAGIRSIEHSCGMLTFPITFLLGDIINEYYGSKAAKLSTYIGLCMSLLVFVIINIAEALPYLAKPYNITQEAFEMIFGSAKIIYLASVGAYLIGSLSDIWLFEIIKTATQGKWLWLRATGSTIISQLIDSFVITYLAFVWGKQLTSQPAATMSEVLQIAVTGYGLKLFLSLAMTPFIYALKYVLTEIFGLTPLPPSSPSPAPPSSSIPQSFPSPSK